MTIEGIAEQLVQAKENIILVYAFNGTGKTRLSVEFKNATKNKDTGAHTGVYYNAYSEDLFYWHNDEDNHGDNKKLIIIPSSLNKFHSLLKEDDVKKQLIPYSPSYNFYFNTNQETSDYESISFFKDGDEDTPIKISRGEERIFIWCFFLALFEVEGWADVQNAHFFIDDPVSSLDDHNIFITASLMLNLIEKQFTHRKIIITTHHIGLFSLLGDWLTKGEKAEKFKHKVIQEDKKTEGDVIVITKTEVEKAQYKICFLELENGQHRLVGRKKGTQLYHLVLFQMLEESKNMNELYIYHFVLLRQVLESVSSFLGAGRFGYVLGKIGIEENKTPDIINALSHQKIYSPKLTAMSNQEKEMFLEIFEKLKINFPFDN